MTPMTDSLDFPHGTTKGYAQGCRSQGGCPGLYGQTCTDARTRANSDWRYGKAVAKEREAEFLKEEHEAAQQQPATPPARPAVARAKANQERAQSGRLNAPVTAKVSDVPLVTDSYDDPTVPDEVVDEAVDTLTRQEAIDRGVHEDGRPFHAPEPPLPTPPVYSRPSRERNGGTEQQRRSQGQLAAHPEQARHAIATATREHPRGLTMKGQPRTYLAPGTVLVAGQLVYRADLNAVLAKYPTGLTEEQQLAAIRERQADPEFEARVREVVGVKPSRAEVIASGTVPPIVEEYIRDGQVPGVSIGGVDVDEALAREGLAPLDSEQDRALRALLRLQQLIGTTDWREVADAVTSVADSIERMAELGLAIAKVKRDR